MTDDNGKNKREFEDIEQTQTFAPIDDNTSPAGDSAEDETKMFEALGDNSGNEQSVNFDNADKSRIAIDGSGKEPLERCEERGAVKNYTVMSVAWRIIRPLLILVVSAALLFYFGNMAYKFVEESYFSPVNAESAMNKKIERSE